MDDLFTEILIKRKTTFLNVFVKILLVMITVLFFLSGLILHPLFMFAGLGMILLDMWMFPRQSVEYEYSYVNGELDIDKIFGKKTRKHAASYHMHDAEVFAPVGSSHLDSFKGIPVTDFTSGEQKDLDSAYAFVISANGKREKVLISPNSNMLNDIRRRIPGKTFLN